MANRFYDAAVNGAMDGIPMNLLSGAIKVVMVDLGQYTPNFATDTFLSDIPAGARFGTPVALTGRTLTNRVFNASNVSGYALPGTQPTLEAAVIFEDTGNASTSRLKMFMDTASSGLPTLANLTSLDINWDTGSNKIARL